MVIVIGGRAFSEPLRTWATNELRGYHGPVAEMPHYRTIAAPLQVDSRSPFWQAKRETISALDLPEFAQDSVGEELPIRFSVGKIQNLLSGRDSRDLLKLQLPGAAELARVMSYERQSHQVVVEAIYWAVHPSDLQDILEQVRNRLLQFVAELRSTMEPGEQQPTVGQVHQAVQNIRITVGDDSPVTINAPVSYARQGSRVSIPTISRFLWRLPR
ncbi:hypothetical protein NBG84_10735 [Streptomyces sp. CWNU-1]|uniref:AbiTii domain-containing protein n=2 Tax=Streptomyces albipurpureus TaxID=2897419 RepID=A0ABT0UMY0_9ACTN|nr:hypothetical protein [Streptomyces sp. CWNU-1]